MVKKEDVWNKNGKTKCSHGRSSKEKKFKEKTKLACLFYFVLFAKKKRPKNTS